MEALKRIGLDLRSADLPINFLSGGERQGVALARALHFGAKLIILDEPTAALSIKESQKVLEFVKSVRDEGLSVIFVTHNLYHVYPIADRFVVLSRGEKVADVMKEETSIDELTKAIVS
jgi:simple sugar transport system ATP-binding protein